MDLNKVPTEISSPARQLLPYLAIAYSILKAIFFFLTGFFSYAYLMLPYILSPLRHLSPVPILRYILAPVFVFLDITVTLFVRTPYRAAVYLVEALYPLYVLVGVACITGAVLGLAARLISRVAIESLKYRDNVEDESLPSRPETGHADMKEVKTEAGERKRKSRKAEKMKAET